MEQILGALFYKVLFCVCEGEIRIISKFIIKIDFLELTSTGNKNYISPDIYRKPTFTDVTTVHRAMSYTLSNPQLVYAQNTIVVIEKKLDIP